MPRKKAESKPEELACCAPVEGGCDGVVYNVKTRLCEPHYRKMKRAEARGETADLSVPVRPDLGALISVYTRVDLETGKHFGCEKKGAMYARAREALEEMALLQRYVPEKLENLLRVARSKKEKDGGQAEQPADCAAA